MKMNKELKKIYEQLTQPEKIEFLKACHLKFIAQTYDGCNASIAEIPVNRKGKSQVVSVRGKNLKAFNAIYLHNYATDEERKSYASHCEAMSECYKIVMSTKGDASQRENIAASKGLNYSKKKIMFLAHKYCYTIKGMSSAQAQQELIAPTKPTKYNLTLMTPQEQLSFLKKCHLKVMTKTFNGSDTTVLNLSGEQNGKRKTICITGKQLKELNKLYIKKYATEEEKQDYTLYCKTLAQCYQIYMTTNKKQVSEYDDNKFKSLAHKYCYLLKGMSEKQLFYEFKKISKYDEVLKKIMTIPIDDKAKIISLLRIESQTHKKYIGLLKARIFGFLLSEFSELSLDERNALQEQLLAKIEVYSRVTAKERRDRLKAEHQQNEKKLLPIAKSIIAAYLNSDLTREQFAKKNSISLGLFTRYLSILKEHDPASYENYSQRVPNRQKKCFDENINVVHELLFYIKNGITTIDGNNRPFDLIDYYLTINVDLNTLTDCIKYQNSSISRSDYKLLRNFIGTITTAQTPLNIDQTLNTTFEINAQRDENGWPIVGTGRVITNDEKQSIIDFLIENNVPLTTKLYDIALRRYINGISNDIESYKDEQNGPQLVKRPNKN